MTRDEAIQGAAMVLEQARARRDAQTPHEAAKAAWYRGHPLGSIEALEALIIRQREQALTRQAAEQDHEAAA
jgi:hypothetical protein